MTVVNVLRVEVGDGLKRIDGIAPNPPTLIRRQIPECGERCSVREMSGQSFMTYDPGERGPSDIFDDRFLPYQIEARLTVKAFEVSVFVEVLHRAPHIIQFTH